MLPTSNRRSEDMFTTLATVDTVRTTSSHGLSYPLFRGTDEPVGISGRQNRLNDPGIPHRDFLLPRKHRL